MNFKEILNYKLIESESYSLSTYNLTMVFILIISTIILLKILKKVFKKYIQIRNLDAGSAWSIYQMLRYLIWVIISVLILESVGVKVSIILASFAALLVGLGFGIQQIFNDIVSGIFILLERNMKIDDILQLKDGTIGKVTYIGLRTSKIKTRDDIIMIIPNSNFVSDKIINWTLIENRTRFYINVGVAYGSDVTLVEKILLQCAKSHHRISKDNACFVRFNDFGESSLDFQLFFWVNDSFYVEHIKSDLRFQIEREFKKNGVHIPFPQRDVYIKTPK
jgi:small-conductance mechanosensitive channel